MNMAAKPDSAPKAETIPTEPNPAPQSPELKAEPRRPAVLGDADIAVLREGLGKGMSGYARQGDILELYNRLADQLEKIEKISPAADAAQAAQVAQASGAEQSAALRAELQGRLKEIETTLSGLEGALRIELAPFLEKAVQEAVKAGQPPQRRRWASSLVFGLTLAAGLVLGVVFYDAILSFVSQAQVRLGF